MTQEIEPVFSEIKTKDRRAFALAELARTAAAETNWHLAAVVEPDQLLFSEENDDSYALHVFLDTPDEVQLLITHEGMGPEQRETAMQKMKLFETHLSASLHANSDDAFLAAHWEQELEKKWNYRQKDGKWQPYKPGFIDQWRAMVQGEAGTGMTFLLIAANCVIFFITVLAGGGWGNTEWDILYQFGGNYTVAIQQGEYWRFLSSVFLHNGIFHLFMNMVGLFYGGVLAERIIGGKRFLLMYLSAGVAGSACSYFFHAETLSVGASGAVFGIFGFLFGHYFLPGTGKELRKAVLIQLLVYIGLNLLYGMKDGIDNWAHAGGLAAGLLVGLAWTYGNAPKEEAEPDEAWNFRTAISGIRLWLMPALIFTGCAGLIQAKPRTLQQYMELMNQADRYYGQAMRAYPNSEDSGAMRKLQDSGIAGWSSIIRILDTAAAIPGLDSGRLALCQRFRRAAEQRQIAYRYVLRAVQEQSPRYYDSVQAAVRLADSLEMRN